VLHAISVIVAGILSTALSKLLCNFTTAPEVRHPYQSATDFVYHQYVQSSN